MVITEVSTAGEQAQLRSSVRGFLDARSPEAAVRRLMDTTEGFDREVWRAMGRDLGLHAIAIPAAYGGLGYSMIELGIVLEEMGRQLLCAPYFCSIVLAANTLLCADDPAAKSDYLPGIASGDTIATLALADSRTARTSARAVASASETAAGWVLDGVAVAVPYGHVADLVLVAAASPRGPSVFAVDGDASGLERIPSQSLDLTRKHATLAFSSVPARLLGGSSGAEQVLTSVRDLACAALAAEAVGGASRCLEMAVDYAKARSQFGQPIGAFQAIKHMCADMYLDVEQARSAAELAARAAAADHGMLRIHAPMAKAFCSEAYVHVAADNIQLHGGIGFTWEHPAHLYYRRALSARAMFGDPAYHRELLARRLRVAGREDDQHG
jgi:alkylation response protein AidB-like acyl-CoA dehydrogenase